MSEEELRPMRSTDTMYVSSNKELTMRKALYYDFMLYQRTLKPFNSFLFENGLKNSMYQQVARPPVMATMSSSGTTIWTVKNENELHDSLQQFLAQNPGALENIETRVYTLDQLFKQKGLNNLFTPETSEQIDANIEMLVSNIAAGNWLFYDRLLRLVRFLIFFERVLFNFIRKCFDLPDFLPPQ